MSKTLDPETRAAIVGALATIGDVNKIAQLYGVKKSTVARIRTYQPMERRPMAGNASPKEAENSLRADADYRAQAETASLQLRDAVRLCVDRMARRAGVPGPDWVAMDARGSVE